MSIRIDDSSTRTAVSNSFSQYEQCSAFMAPFGGSPVTARIRTAAGIGSTLTLAPFSIDASGAPLRVLSGARQARTNFLSGAVTSIEFLNIGGTLIATITDPVALAALNASFTENLSSGFLQASASLPTGLELFTAGAPFRVVIENWASGSAVDAGTITLSRVVATNAQFQGSALAAQNTGWNEYGAAEAYSALPSIAGTRFFAKSYFIKAGGAYSTPGQRLMIMAHCDDLRAGIFGDVLPSSVRTKPPAHKIRIEDYFGTVLERIEMRDGLPINSPTFIQDMRAGGASAAPSRPYTTTATAYYRAYGSKPVAATAGRVPRAFPSMEILNSTIGQRGATRGSNDEHTLVADGIDNGYAHPRAIPQWPLSLSAAQAYTLPATDPELITGSAGNWVSALTVGIGYEPGAMGGWPRRKGTGGMRIDSTVSAAEPLQYWLRSPSGTRALDSLAFSVMADGWISNGYNVPSYRAADYLTLKPVDPILNGLPVQVGEKFAIWDHYYGDSTIPAYATNSGVRVVDTYGSGQQWSLLTGSGRTSFPWSGWAPETEHKTQVTLAHAAMIYADPAHAHAYEHIVTEDFALAKGFAGLNGAPFVDNSGAIADPAGAFCQRTNTLEFLHAVMAWETATTTGLYTRAKLEARFRLWMAAWKTNVWDAIPATGRNAAQTAWALGYRTPIHWRAPDTADSGGGYTGSLVETYNGWTVGYSLGSIYLADALMYCKQYGLETVLRTGGTAPENAACSYWLDQAQESLAFQARVFVAAPWAWVLFEYLGNAENAHPYIPIRSVAQGAVQATLSTIPAYSAATAITNAGSNPRGDNQWWKRADGTARQWAQTMDYLRITGADTYWRWIAPAGAERTAALASLDTYIAAMSSFLTATAAGSRANAIPGAQMFYFNLPRRLPALE